MGQTERFFLTILVLAILALVASSPMTYRLRRSRMFGMLLSGGWLAIAAGALLGESGLGALERETLLRSSPLIMICLGWIGLMVGLQARRELFATLPRALWRLATIDVLVSAVVFGFLGWVAAALWISSVGAPGTEGAAWRVMPALIIGAAAIGWTMETRSMRISRSLDSARLAVFVRGGGALGAIAAITLFGLISKPVARDPASGQLVLDWFGAGAKLAMSLAMAVTLGILGRYALRLAGRSRAELLAVFLGLVALVAGIAADLATSALFTAMLAGVVIANLGGPALRMFERFILRAEHVMAVLLAMLAGMLIDPAIGIWGLGLAMSIAILRLILKPWIFRVGIRPLSEPVGSPLFIAPVRQAPMAMALGLGLVISDPTPLHQKMLTVVLLAGLTSEVLPLLLTLSKSSGVTDAPSGSQDVASAQSGAGEGSS